MLVAAVEQPAALEFANGMLNATFNTFGNGAVVTNTP